MTTLKDVARILREDLQTYQPTRFAMHVELSRMAEIVEAAQVLREVVTKEIPMPKAAKALAHLNKLEQEP